MLKSLQAIGLALRKIRLERALVTDCTGSPVTEFDITDAERLLAGSADHRVLKRVPPVIGWPLAKSGGQVKRAVFIDIKATGRSIDRDQIMALGSVAFSYDASSGAMVEADEPRTFDDLAREDVEALAEGIDLFVAHHAAFVRPLVEKLSSRILDTNWACSYDEIGWADEGLWSARIDDLLMRLGWFNDGSDVASHARAGAFLMSLTLPRSERTVMSALLAHARRPLMAVRALDTPWKLRDAMKHRGYHWDTGSSGVEAAWWILTETPEVEIAWLSAEIYPNSREVTPIAMPASRRYSAQPWR